MARYVWRSEGARSRRRTLRGIAPDRWARSEKKRQSWWSRLSRRMSISWAIPGALADSNGNSARKACSISGSQPFPWSSCAESNLAEFDQERLDAYSVLGGSSPDLSDKLVRDHRVLLSRALLARWSAANAALSRESMA